MDALTTYKNRLAFHAKRVREKKGLRQSDLAEMMNTSSSAVWTLEHGRHNANLATIVALAEALGIEVSELFKPESE
ncbi:helix-turn-helix transcriptional regulator [Thioclava sp. BHET1]|nr:helix-turn-helix transcriptional regulator [Thioclava sp. BHET1]